MENTKDLFTMRALSLIENIERLARLSRICELLGMGEDEKDFNRLLASVLGAEANKVIRGVEADILRRDEALEIKVRQKDSSLVSVKP